MLLHQGLHSPKPTGPTEGTTELLKQLLQPQKAHTPERTLPASLSGPTEPKRGRRWQFSGSHHYQWQKKAVSALWVAVKTAVHGVVAWRFPKVQPSAGTVMCTVFWVKKGVFLLDFLCCPWCIEPYLYLSAAMKKGFVKCYWPFHSPIPRQCP